MMILTGFTASVRAQEVSVPDPGLNAAIREAVQKPSEPLTEQDLLNLTSLSAGGKSITNVAGLEAARNLRILDLDNNSITSFTIASVLTNLSILDLFHNHLAGFVLSNASPNFTIIDIGFNSLTQCSLPDGLTNLDTLFLEGNGLANFDLPAGLTKLTQLDLSGNSLTSFAVRADMMNLTTFLAFANQLTNLSLPANLRFLTGLDLDFNQLPNLDLPTGLTTLFSLVARDNQLTNVTFPADMTNLSFVDLGGNRLANLSLPAGLSRLNFFRVPDNNLTSLTLPPGLTNLAELFLQNNQLTNLTFSSGLNHLVQLDVRTNSLTSLTLPPDMTNLLTLALDGNPLTTLVLPEPLVAANLAPTVAALRTQGVQVFTYPLAVQLALPQQQPIGAFRFTISGPPGDYIVLSSTNLADWSVLGPSSIPLGAIIVTDTTAQFSPRKFYRAMRQDLPANLVFVPANTFTMGSPATEVGHQADEGPQTVVTLSRGFWVSRFLVTQADYLAVTGSNPSQFPGDLNRPVESVSWFAASNYCAQLTQLDLAAGRIPPGSHYRLPTEAEWECAARAGTTTRFYYGDDSNVTGLTNHAWYSANSGSTTHPVGQKSPNPWGLYDMAGNVWEWCQDWYGTYPGGAVTDPQGPATNPIGFKVIRGGAWEAFELDCRSARRSIEGASPFISDFIIGFRVVLASDL